MPKSRSPSTARVVARVLFALILVAAAVSASSADVTLLLRNGDRISGTVVMETTNSITISPHWAPQLTIPLSEIVARESKPMQATTVPPGSAPPAVVAAKASAEVRRPRSWHGKVDVGTDLGFSQNTRQLYYGKAKVIYAPDNGTNQPQTWLGHVKNTFEYQATYGKTDGLLSANRMDGSSKTDFSLAKRIFLYNLAGLGYDEIRKIDYQYEVGPGVGYRLFMRTNFAVNTEIGMDYQAQSFTGNVYHERFSIRVAEDSLWTISKKLSLDQKLEFFPSVDTSRFFRVRFESNLRYSLWQNISLSLSVIDNYDANPAEGVSNNDLQVHSTIGVSF